MSAAQNSFDSYNNSGTGGSAGGGAIGGATGTSPNADFDLKDAQLDEASSSDGFKPENILSGGIGGMAQNASHIVKQGTDAVVNAGKGIMEMGGSVISGLKRGFSKTSETGGEQGN